MEQLVKILVIEDEMVIGANLSMQLTELGYEVSALLPRGEDALPFIRNEKPDIVLMDIQLKGRIDGIETAQLIQTEYDIPIIYLTSNTDKAHFDRAKSTRPRAFISKPYKNLDLQRAIELTIESRFKDQDNAVNNDFVLADRIFVRNNDKLMAVPLEDICYLEADRNYCRIFTSNKDFLLVGTLKAAESKLPRDLFLRVHRSYIVNLLQINEVASNHLSVSGKTIPVNKVAKPALLKRLNTL